MKIIYEHSILKIEYSTFLLFRFKIALLLVRDREFNRRTAYLSLSLTRADSSIKEGLI